jgi:hypothetical protein
MNRKKTIFINSIYGAVVQEPLLKVVSIEIDSPESGINRKVFFKGSGAEIFS